MPRKRQVPLVRGTVLVVAMLCARRAFAQTRRGVDGPVLGARQTSPTVSIKAWNPTGSIRFVAWDKDSVVVHGAVGRNVKFELSGQGEGMKLGAIKLTLGVEGHWNDADAAPSQFVVYMPRHGAVSVKTVSADIISDGVGGWFYSVSGSIRLSGQVTSVDAETMDGSLDMNVSTSWVKARAGNGSLLVRGQPQDVDASTVGGTLSIATSSVLRGQFSSVTGDVHFVGDPAPRAILDFSSHSGAVDLLLPQDASAALALSSVSGPIENGFTRVRPTALTPQSMRLNLGRGEAQMTVRTFRGAIRLRAQ
jgi:hypothetical protein